MTSVNDVQFPESWADAEELAGYDLIDKYELIGVPFMIRAVRFETNKRGINFVYVDAERADGSAITFNDSSTGVRQDVVNYLTEKGKEAAIDTGERTPVAILVRRGLRVSEFETPVQERGREVMKKARVFYLTKSGVPATDVAPVKATRSRAKA
jgi:hypothetical protein